MLNTLCLAPINYGFFITVTGLYLKLEEQINNFDEAPMCMNMYVMRVKCYTLG